MVNKKVSSYLRLNKKTKKPKRRRAQNFSLKEGFFATLINNELKISFLTYIFLSLTSSVVAYFLYMRFTKNSTFSLVLSLLCLTLPTLIYKTSATINRIVESALEYKAFVSSLESSMRATNSTREALLMTSSDPSLAKGIKNAMEDISTSIKLGDTIENSLTAAIKKSKNPYFSMALSIVKINHRVGSSSSIAALNNIEHQMNLILENVQLLKDKIMGIVSQKLIFLFALLACPMIHAKVMADMADTVYASKGAVMLLCGIYIFAFIGQFIIDYFAAKAIKGV